MRRQRPGEVRCFAKPVLELKQPAFLLPKSQPGTVEGLCTPQLDLEAGCQGKWSGEAGRAGKMWAVEASGAMQKARERHFGHSELCFPLEIGAEK